MSHDDLKKNDSQNHFMQFWSTYPRKKNKAQALKAWKKIKNPSSTLSLITHALSWQTKSHDWKKDGGQFIPYPATYLNAEAWKDEPTAKQTNGADEWLADQNIIEGDFVREH